MIDEEIERLKKKVQKKPQSTFSLILAEKYEEKGMINEAIDTLVNALKHRSGYTSARVALGKLYLSNGAVEKAQSEFEEVIAKNPDNILAHKKLADIYLKQKMIKEASDQYRKVLELSPDDKEAKAMLPVFGIDDSGDVRKAWDGPSRKSGSGRTAGKRSSKKTGKGAEPAEQAARDTGDEKSGAPVYEIEDEIDTSDIDVNKPERITPVEEGPVSKELERFRSFMRERAQGAASVRDGKKKGRKKDPMTGETAHFQDEFPDQWEQADSGGEKDDDKIVISLPTQTMADIFVSQDLYDKAMDVYNEMLSADPDNQSLIQKRKELEALIRIKKGESG